MTRHVEGTVKASDSPAPSAAVGEVIYIPEAHRRYVRRHFDPRGRPWRGLGAR